MKAYNYTHIDFNKHIGISILGRIYLSCFSFEIFFLVHRGEAVAKSTLVHLFIVFIRTQFSNYAALNCFTLTFCTLKHVHHGKWTGVTLLVQTVIVHTPLCTHVLFAAWKIWLCARQSSKDAWGQDCLPGTTIQTAPRSLDLCLLFANPYIHGLQEFIEQKSEYLPTNKACFEY